jgi:hypothetical protein
VEVDDDEAHELDQDYAFGQGQRDGATVGGTQFLLQVHLGNLAGQRLFVPFPLGLPLVQLPVVNVGLFASGGTSQGFLGDLPAQQGELPERFLQVRVATAEDGVTLGQQGLGSQRLTAQQEFQRCLKRWAGIGEVLGNQGEEAFQACLAYPEVGETLIV